MPCRTDTQFSHTNRKHFTDPMGFPIVKMGNKNSQIAPFPLHDVDTHLIQQCLSRPHAPPQTAAPTDRALSHKYGAKFPLVSMGRPTFAPKLPLPVDESPSPTTCLIPAQFDLPCQTASESDPLFFHSPLDRQTDTQTDRWLTGMVCNYSPLSSYRQQRGLKITGFDIT